MNLRPIAAKCVEIANRHISAQINHRKWKQMVDVSVDEPEDGSTYHVRLYGMIKGKDYNSDTGCYMRFELEEYNVILSAMIDGNFYFGDELNILFRDESTDIS